jgi:hypothetical protein
MFEAETRASDHALFTSPLFTDPGGKYTSNEYNQSLGEERMTEQAKLDIPTCQMCGKAIGTTLSTHHVIPRFLGIDDETTIEICRTCHTKADRRFIHLLLDPFDDNGFGVSYAYPGKVNTRQRIYKRKYYKHKSLFRMKLEERFYCVINLYYNTKTKHIQISNGRERHGAHKRRY